MVPHEDLIGTTVDNLCSIHGLDSRANRRPIPISLLANHGTSIAYCRLQP